VKKSEDSRSICFKREKLKLKHEKLTQLEIGVEDQATMSLHVITKAFILICLVLTLTSEASDEARIARISGLEAAIKTASSLCPGKISSKMFRMDFEKKVTNFHKIHNLAMQRISLVSSGWTACVANVWCKRRETQPILSSEIASKFWGQGLKECGSPTSVGSIPVGNSISTGFATEVDNTNEEELFDDEFAISPESTNFGIPLTSVNLVCFIFGVISGILVYYYKYQYQPTPDMSTKGKSLRRPEL